MDCLQLFIDALVESGRAGDGSGLGWTDVDLERLIDLTACHLRGLGVGFSPYISGPGLILTMNKVANTLERLAVPFCAPLRSTPFDPWKWPTWVGIPE